MYLTYQNLLFPPSGSYLSPIFQGLCEIIYIWFMRSFPVRNRIPLYVVLKNIAIAHLIIVHHNTFLFQVLFLKWYIVIY